ARSARARDPRAPRRRGWRARPGPAPRGSTRLREILRSASGRWPRGRRRACDGLRPSTPPLATRIDHWRTGGMSTFFAIIGSTIGGWIGWVVGAKIGFMTAYMVSTVGSAVGFYYGRRVHDGLLD